MISGYLLKNFGFWMVKRRLFVDTFAEFLYQDDHCWLIGLIHAEKRLLEFSASSLSIRTIHCYGRFARMLGTN